MADGFDMCNLTEEQMRSLDDVMAYMDEESIELTEGQGEAVSGGDWAGYVNDVKSVVHSIGL